MTLPFQLRRVGPVSGQLTMNAARWPFALTLPLVLSACAAIDAWPAWRADFGNRGFADTVIADQPKQLWAYNDGQDIIHNLIVTSDTVWAGDDEAVVALDRETGNRRCIFRKPGYRIVFEPLARGPNLWVALRGTGDDRLIEVDPANCTETKNIELEHRLSAQPLLAAGGIAVLDAPKLEVRAASDGHVIWFKDVGSKSLPTFLAYAPLSETLVLAERDRPGAEGGRLTAYSTANNAAHEWSFDTTIVPTPPIVFIERGQEVVFWMSKTSRRDLNRTNNFVADLNLNRASNGAAIWTSLGGETAQAGTVAQISEAAVTADGTIIVPGRGYLGLHRASDGSELATIQVKSPVLNLVAAQQGKAIVSSAGAMSVVNMIFGNQSYPLQDSVDPIGSIAVAGRTIFVVGGYRRHSVFAYR